MNKQTNKAAAANEAAAAKKLNVTFDFDKVMREAQNFGLNLRELQTTYAAKVKHDALGLRKTLKFAAAVTYANNWYKDNIDTFCSTIGIKKISKEAFIDYIGISETYYYRLIKGFEIADETKEAFFAACDAENSKLVCGLNELIKFAYPPKVKEAAAESEAAESEENEAAESESAATNYVKNLLITFNGRLIYERSQQTKQSAQISGEAAEIMAVIDELKTALRNIEAAETNDAAAIFAASGEAEKYLQDIEAAEIDEIDE